MRRITADWAPSTLALGKEPATTASDAVTETRALVQIRAECGDPPDPGLNWPKPLRRREIDVLRAEHSPMA